MPSTFKFLAAHADALFSGVALVALSAGWRRIRAVKRGRLRTTLTTAYVLAVSAFGVALLAALGVRGPWELLVAAGTGLGNFVRTPITLPVWVCLAALLAAGAIPLLLVVGYVRITADDWQQYRTDVIHDVRWRWSYANRHGGIEGLAAYCPTPDDTLLVAQQKYYNQWHLHCESCGATFGPYDVDIYDLKRRVERQIDRKVRTGEWRALLSAGA